MFRVNQLSGFGGGGSAAPQITSSSEVTAVDNHTLSFTVVTNLSTTLVIGGTDAAKFEIASNTLAKTHVLRWASNGVKHITTPDDADTDGVYDITLTATDTTGAASSSQSVAVTLDYDWSNVVAFDFTTNSTDYAGYTLRETFDSLIVGGSGGTVVRLSLRGGGTMTTVLALYIGEKAASGDVWDMKASAPAPTQLLVSGSGSFNIPAGELVRTDPATFTIDETKSYVVSVAFDSVASLKYRTSFPGSSIAVNLKSAVNEAATPDVSGYSALAAGTVMLVESIDAATPT